MLIPLIAGGAAFGAVVLAVVYAFISVESKIEGRSSLKAIESYSWKGNDLVGKELSFVDRVLIPFNDNVLKFAKRVTPIGYVQGIQHKLIVAGRRGPDELDRFLAIRTLTLAAVPVAVVLELLILPAVLEGKYLAFAVGLTVVGLVLLPEERLKGEVKARKKQIRRSLPDTLDLLTISVEAGLGFEQAVDRITSSVEGPLSDELSRMIGEMRAGSARADALLGLDTRTAVEEIKSFVLAMVQADQFGVSIGSVLRAQADEMRLKRRQLAQEAAQKAPVKMLLPMTFCIFPALFIVLLGPAAISIMNNL